MTKTNRRLWKISEVAFLRANLHLSDKELAAKMGITPMQVKGARHRHGLSKPTGFPKGSTPWNKGKSYNAGGRSAETQFKAGRQSEKSRPMYEVFQQDDSGTLRLFIKLPHNRRCPYGRYVWERHNGPLAKGYVIRFQDGNPLNCELANLEKVSRAENARRNANRSKAAQSLRGTWAVVRTFQDSGLTPPYKFRARRAG